MKNPRFPEDSYDNFGGPIDSVSEPLGLAVKITFKRLIKYFVIGYGGNNILNRLVDNYE